ncbi:MAG: hypothetical protein K2X95_12735 [Flavobacteriaceae bacterium]|nr:hypothetical protein [Flavobacteriaceae bacterium]
MENQYKSSQETEENWSKDPNNWIWGLFYYNKEDKRIFPPKKIAWMGNTVNFANRNSVLFMIGFILFSLFIVSMILKNH